MLEIKLNTAVFISFRDIRAVEKGAFPMLFCGGKVKREESLKGGDGL